MDGYIHALHHTGIGLNTPADVHLDRSEAKARQWPTNLADARTRNLERFTPKQDPRFSPYRRRHESCSPAVRTE